MERVREKNIDIYQGPTVGDFKRVLATGVVLALISQIYGLPVSNDGSRWDRSVLGYITKLSGYCSR